MAKELFFFWPALFVESDGFQSVVSGFNGISILLVNPKERERLKYLSLGARLMLKNCFWRNMMGGRGMDSYCSG
jgi:hypothetical protein